MIMACIIFAGMIPTMGLTLVLITIMANSDPVGADTLESSGGYAELHIGDYGEPQSAHAKDINATSLLISDESMEEEIAGMVRSLELARRSLGGILDQQVGLLSPLLERAIAAANLSEQCSRVLMQAVGSAQSQQSWAIQMFSSWGKFLAGVSNHRSVGAAASYADCVSVGQSRYCSLHYRPLLPDFYRYKWAMNKDTESFSRLRAGSWGRRAESASADTEFNTTEGSEDALGSWTAEMLSRTNFQLRFQEVEWGTCLPLSCSADDAMEMAHYLGHQAGLRVSSFACSSSNEEDKSLSVESQDDPNTGALILKPDMTRSQLVAMMILSFLTGIIVFATLIDVLFVRVPEWLGENDLTMTAASSFAKGSSKSALLTLVDDCSLLRNLRRLLDVKRGPDEGQILCINGIRCIICLLIISAHCIQRMDVAVSSLSLFGQFLLDRNWLNPFFSISGFVNALTIFKKRRNEDPPRSLSVPVYAIGRYLRLLPQLLLATAIFIILPVLPDGGNPEWSKIAQKESDRCSKQWWRQILFIQSFDAFICNAVAWYLTADMLFHLSALVVIFLAFHLGRRAAHIVSGLILLASTTAAAINHHRYKFGINLYSSENPNHYDGYYWLHLFDYHFDPVNHALPYFCGLYIGYILAIDEQRICSWLTTTRARLVWILTSVLFIIQLYTFRYPVLGFSVASPLPTIIWNIERLIWTAFFLWIIVACSLGFGGWINDLLSCKLFVVFGRASYMIYLIQLIIVDFIIGYTETAHWQNPTMIPFLVTGTIILTLMFGGTLCIAFELPWLQLQGKIVRLIRLAGHSREVEKAKRSPALP